MGPRGEALYSSVDGANAPGPNAGRGEGEGSDRVQRPDHGGQILHVSPSKPPLCLQPCD